MRRSLRQWSYLHLDQWGWADPSLELQNGTVSRTRRTQTLAKSFVEQEFTYMSLSYSVELHNTPTAAAGFSPHNTTDVACSECFWGGKTLNHLAETV